MWLGEPPVEDGMVMAGMVYCSAATRAPGRGGFGGRPLDGTCQCQCPCHCCEAKQ
jgi:hypothetical protein